MKLKQKSKNDKQATEQARASLSEGYNQVREEGGNQAILHDNTSR